MESGVSEDAVSGHIQVRAWCCGCWAALGCCWDGVGRERGRGVRAHPGVVGVGPELPWAFDVLTSCCWLLLRAAAGAASDAGGQAGAAARCQSGIARHPGAPGAGGVPWRDGLLRLRAAAGGGLRCALPCSSSGDGAALDPAAGRPRACLHAVQPAGRLVRLLCMPAALLKAVSPTHPLSHPSQHRRCRHR